MILVTGASGFLGQHLLQALASRSMPVVALFHSSAPVPVNGVQWKQCDLLDQFAIEEALAGITQVYHCAATVSFDPRDRSAMIHNNVAATRNLVDAALEKGLEKMVHVSSIASLGRTNNKLQTLIDEDTHWEDSHANSAYAESKFQAEMEVWRAMAEGLNAVIVNPGIILGEGEWDKGSANLMSIVDREFPWYTEGVNAWVDVKDVVAAMLLLMNSDISEQRFILSCGNYSYKEIFGMMAVALDKRPPHKKATPLITELVWRLELIKSRLRKQRATISRESARTAQTKCYYSNARLLEKFPHFRYTPLEETIERMASAYMAGRT